MPLHSQHPSAVWTAATNSRALAVRSLTASENWDKIDVADIGGSFVDGEQNGNLESPILSATWLVFSSPVYGGGVLQSAAKEDRGGPLDAEPNICA
jgi:hypothetical protein